MDENDAIATVNALWRLFLDDLNRMQRIDDYITEKRGLPVLPENTDAEVRRIRDFSYKNVLTMVRDTFANSLAVTGFQDADTGNDEAAWELWQQNGMDSRQSEIYSFALTYGCAYVIVLPSDEDESKVEMRVRSPRQIVAAYKDVQIDKWPQYALETWIEEEKDGSATRKGNLYTPDQIVPLTLGTVTDKYEALHDITARVDEDRAIATNPFDHVPVIRYCFRQNKFGEIFPLLTAQRAINNVNFDRLMVSRFGAFPQKVISNWDFKSNSEVAATSVKRTWAFADDVKAQQFSPADVGQWNDILSEMLRHVARVAQISPTITADQISNVSADALAAAESDQSRKLDAMRESYGESHEQMMICAATIAGVELPSDTAEVMWRDTDARAFGSTVDGITKLEAAGVPIEDLLFLVPGMTQQKIKSIATKVQANRAKEERLQLQQSAAAARANPTTNAVAAKGKNNTAPAQQPAPKPNPDNNSGGGETQ